MNIRSFWKEKNERILMIEEHRMNISVIHYVDIFIMSILRGYVPFTGDLDCYYNQTSRRMVDYANHRLTVWCSQQQYPREDLAISFIPAGCYISVRLFSPEYFTVCIMRQNKTILKVSVDTAYIGKVL